MPNIKIPNVAGMFYPEDPEELREMVRGFIDGKETEGVLPEAVIAPHAGYRYSGNTAGTAYAYVKNGREVFKRAVVLGTPHRVYFPGIAASSAEYFETPLGNIAVDTDAVKKICALPQARIVDEAFEEEHSLEVQLPFLQTALDAFSLVPLLVGPGEPERTAEVIEMLKSEGRTVVAVSSDLSHFLKDAQARVLDAQTSEMIEQLAVEGWDGKRACGVNGILGLLCYARRRGLRARTVHLTNSGEETGDLMRVVGYGAYVFA